MRKLRIILIALTVCFIFCAVFTDCSEVSTNAMMPSMAKGDIVISFTPRFLPYHFTEGQILKIRTDEDSTSPNYLRLIASGNHEITCDSNITIDGIQLERQLLTSPDIMRPIGKPEIWREKLPNGAHYQISTSFVALKDQRLTTKLENGQLFLLGDNRIGAYDSRQRGPFVVDDIEGKVLFVLYSVKNDALISHLFKWPD